MRNNSNKEMQSKHESDHGMLQEGYSCSEKEDGYMYCVISWTNYTYVHNISQGCRNFGSKIITVDLWCDFVNRTSYYYKIKPINQLVAITIIK
jgi:hypothetical protein